MRTTFSPCLSAFVVLLLCVVVDCSYRYPPKRPNHQGYGNNYSYDNGYPYPRVTEPTGDYYQVLRELGYGLWYMRSFLAPYTTSCSAYRTYLNGPFRTTTFKQYCPILSASCDKVPTASQSTDCFVRDTAFAISITCCSAQTACDSSPCRNSGSCSNNGNSFICRCIDGFTGTQCEIPPSNACTSSPCGNNGYCSNGGNSFTCTCINGFTGTRCEIAPNACNSSPCGNNGYCSIAGNSFTCTCINGFTGTRCEIAPNACNSSPCGNNGFCSNVGNSFTCTCINGFTGTRCQTALTTTTPLPSSTCGVSTVARIVGGTNTSECELPWVVGIRRNGNFICGGAIINRRQIVTAAHCVRADATYSVEIGKWRTNSFEDTFWEDISVTTKVIHPDFDSIRLLNDIAILTLSRTLTYSICVKPICLPNSLQPLSTAKCTSAGWGTTFLSGPQPAILQKVDLTVYSSSACIAKFNEPSTVVTSAVLCADNDGLGGKDACQGDSGGPLMCKIGAAHYLFGVVSSGRGCADAGQAGFYTSVPYFRNWIDSQSVI